MDMVVQDEISVSAEAASHGALTAHVEVGRSVDLEDRSASVVVTGRGRKRRREDPPLQLVADEEVAMLQPVEDGDGDAAQDLAAAVVGSGGGEDKELVVRLTRTRRRSTSKADSRKVTGVAGPEPLRQCSPETDGSSEAVIEVEAGEFGPLCPCSHPHAPVSACHTRVPGNADI